MPPDDKLTGELKAMAEAEGFDRVAIAPADSLPEVAVAAYRQFLRLGYHGAMGYLGRDLDKRFAPRLLVDGARSVICLAVSYAPGEGEAAAEHLIAFYARGADYHAVLKRRCRRLMDRIRRIAPRFAARAYVDAGPIMERSLAAMSGLGWIGRNGCLIVPGLGSYVVLCEIVCNLPLEPGAPQPSRCGDCDACVAACPTGACLGDCMIDARRCISYLSVEHRGPVDKELPGLWGPRLFGCDACQAACPHNKDVRPGDAELCGRDSILGGASLGDILTWTRGDWDAATRGSAVRRAGYEGLMRNAVLAAAGSGDLALTGKLTRLGRGLPELAGLIGRAVRRLSAGNPN